MAHIDPMKGPGREGTATADRERSSRRWGTGAKVAIALAVVALIALVVVVGFVIQPGPETHESP
jgi:hypothetical protein